MQQLISNIVSGMSYGSVYALLAVGLVLTYKTSGIFNLAYGAQAFVSGAIYYDLRVRHHWPIPLAFILAVLVVAPLLGILLDRVLFRYLRTASPVARLVTVLGLARRDPADPQAVVRPEPAVRHAGHRPERRPRATTRSATSSSAATTSPPSASRSSRSSG